MSTAIDFQKMRAQMRAEAAKERAQRQQRERLAELLPEPEPEPEPEPVQLPQTPREADDPLRAPFASLAIQRACTPSPQPSDPSPADGGWSIPLHVLVHEPGEQLEEYDVGASVGLPPASVHYIPAFVTAAEEQRLLDVLYSPSARSRWLGTAGKHGRRTQNWGGNPTRKQVVEPLPPFCVALIEALVGCGVFPAERAPNHVLVNEYGCEGGLVAHVDGPLYHPRVACLSLGGTASMKLWRSFEDAELESDGKPGPGPAAQIFLRPRSLNVLSDPVYTNVLHSIDATAVDTISELCCNAQLAEVTKGEAIERQERRLSLVFVHKLEPDYEDTARGD